MRTMIRRGIAATCVFGAATGGLHAQTCGAPLTMAPDSTVEASSCGAQPFAGGAVSGPGAVFSLALDHASSVVFDVAAPFFDPAVCVMAAGECGTGTCLATGDASAPAAIDGLPAGSYLVIVTASPYSAPGSCGNFLLRNETTAADTIHADGFD